MSHKKPQRLQTIEQIVNREFIQGFLLGLMIIFLFGVTAYIAFLRG